MPRSNFSAQPRVRTPYPTAKATSGSATAKFTWALAPLVLTTAVLCAMCPPARAQADGPQVQTLSADEHSADEHSADEHSADEHSGHNHGGHGHRFELGLAPGLVYLLGESEFTFGLHAHLVANLGDSPWGLGLGFERLFDEHAHNTASLVVQFRITDPWSVIVAPGLTFEDDEPGAVQPSAHIETAYEFALGDVHLGPSLEIAIDPEDVHVTLGVHVGLGM